MKLERFKVERDTPSIKTLLISFSIILLFILMFLVNKSHALYRVTESHDVIKARVGNFIYNINYDLDGGSLPDGVENPSSYSSVEETTITNPVKEGYTFKGWEGFSRNLFDEKSILMAIDGATYENEHYVFTIGNAHRKYAANDNKLPIDNFKANTSYTITIKGHLNQVNEQYGGLIFTFCYTDETKYYVKFNSTTEDVITFTSPNNKTISKINMSYGAGGDYLAYIKSIQLEEGDTATEWEPYLKKDIVIPKFTRGDISLKAIWEKKEATFDTGSNFNTKIKILAGNTNATYETSDSNITSIQRSNILPASWIVNDEITPPSDNNIISTSDSKYPIYAWYDNGTIYYYTEVLNPKMNSSSLRMFRGLYEVTTIEIDSIDTSSVYVMRDMFQNDSKLTNVDLSNFNTENVYDMWAMFAWCSSLKNINVSSFNTHNVENTGYMFAGTAIEELDLSSFDLSKLSTYSAMLSRVPLKRLKTPNTYPTNTSVTIDLPKTLYDESSNAYTSLNNESPTNTWLTSTQQ